MSKRKRRLRKLTAMMCVMAMMTLLFLPASMQEVSAAKVSKKMYTLSKGSGTYQNAVTVRIKAKKGYKVYYTLNNKKFTTKKMIASGKSLKIKIAKTTTLKIIAVKKTKKITNKLLKTKKLVEKAKAYTYTIKSATDTQGQSGTSGTSNGNAAGSQDAAKNEGGQSENSGNVGETGENTDHATETDRPSVTTLQHYEVQKPENDLQITDGEGQQVSENSVAITSVSENGITETSMTVSDGGSYVLSGSAENLTIDIQTTDDVDLTLSSVYIDNSSLTSDDPAILISKKNQTRIMLDGHNLIAGATGYATKPASALICQDVKGGTLCIDAKSEDAILVLADQMTAETAASCGKDPTDGISAKGKLIVNGGKISIETNGDALKGTNDGITVNGGTLSLSSTLGSAMKSKSAAITINGGNIVCEADSDDAVKAYNKSDLSTAHQVMVTGGALTVVKSGGYGIRSCVVSITGGQVLLQNTKEDGIRAKAGTSVDADAKTSNTKDDGTGLVSISDGSVVMENIGGDGIQGENVVILGGSVQIATIFENATTQYYSVGKTSSEYPNSIVTSGNGVGGGSTVKTETVTQDTGSHKGIKAGTKAKAFTYTSVEEGSEYEAGTAYTQSASGSLVISGGSVEIDTTATGIKYNQGNDNQVIIGAPEDGINCNNTGTISGGTVIIHASDDGISAGEKITFSGDAFVDIRTAYEGIESPQVIVGTQGATSGPKVAVYTNDDGINASGKTQVYVYADEDESSYTKTTTSKSGNSCTIYSGYLNVCIGDDVTSHSVTLTGSDGVSKTYTFSSQGDGIDCNGSFYAYGGTTVVYGMSSGSESPIDMDDEFVIGDSAELFLAGCDSMGETQSASSTGQAFVIFSGSSSGSQFGPGGMGGGPGGMGAGSQTLVSAGTSIGILDATGNVIEAATLPKNVAFIMCVSGKLTNGSTYTLSTGGTVSGLKVSDVSKDYRYAGYSGGTAKTTASATTKSTSGGSGNPSGPGR